jgi:hypothetical protein
LAGDARFVDGVTFLGHTVVVGVRFVCFLGVHLTYMEACWHSAKLLDTERFSSFRERASACAREGARECKVNWKRTRKREKKECADEEIAVRGVKKSELCTEISPFWIPG